MFLSFHFNQNYSNNTNSIRYFIIHGLVLFIKLISSVEHMLYAWSFSHNAAVPIAIKQNKLFIYLNTQTTVYIGGAGNSNKNKT